MNAPRLTRREFTAALGGIVLSFSLAPKVLLGQTPAQLPGSLQTNRTLDAWLRINAAFADYTHSLPIPEAAPDGPRAAFFPGSSLGNFEPADAAIFLRLVRDTVGRHGHLLIGVDRTKDGMVLDAAYNDAAGVTARFNLNLLQRANAELGADFDLDAFSHYAFYNAEFGRIEMHLVSLRPQEVKINGNVFAFAAGESLHTENSYKYSPEAFTALAGRAGFRCLAQWTDAREYFGVYLLAAS